MKKLILSSIVASTLIFSTANAGVLLDFEVGAGVWMTKTSGDINYSKDDSISLEDDLGLDSSTNNYFYADFNHFVPIVPNIRIERQVLVTDANKNTTVTFGSFASANASTATNLDLSQNDLILYWGIPGLSVLSTGILNVDFGLDIKQFDGSITLKDRNNTSNNQTVDLDFVIPMGYLAAKVKPPFMPVIFSASTKVIAYNSSSLSDTMVKASIKLPLPSPLIDFKIDIGYKSQVLDLDEKLSDNFNGKITNDGIFAGISAKF